MTWFARGLVPISTAIGIPMTHRDRHGDAGDDEEVERVLPVAEEAERQERARHQEGDPPACGRQTDVRRQDGDPQPADLRHRARQVGPHDHPLHPVDRAAQQLGDRVGDLHDRVGVAAREEVVLPLGEAVVEVGARGAGDGQGVGAVQEPPDHDPDTDDRHRRDPAAHARGLVRRWHRPGLDRLRRSGRCEGAHASSSATTTRMMSSSSTTPSRVSPSITRMGCSEAIAARAA